MVFQEGNLNTVYIPAEASTFSGSIWAVIREAWCTLESFWTHRVYIYVQY